MGIWGDHEGSGVEGETPRCPVDGRGPSKRLSRKSRLCSWAESLSEAREAASAVIDRNGGVSSPGRVLAEPRARCGCRAPGSCRCPPRRRRTPRRTCSISLGEGPDRVRRRAVTSEKAASRSTASCRERDRLTRRRVGTVGGCRNPAHGLRFRDDRRYPTGRDAIVDAAANQRRTARPAAAPSPVPSASQPSTTGGVPPGGAAASKAGPVPQLPRRSR